MNLPYCPICRKEVASNAFAWICWRHKVRGKAEPPATGTSSTHRSAVDAAYASAPPSQTGTGSFGGDEVGELCYQFNEPHAKACTSEACGRGVRDPEHSCPACPSCRIPLPYHSNLHARTITVTGPRAAGKTHYIVALNGWWEDNLPSFDLQATKVMRDTVEKSFDELSTSIRDEGGRAQATVPGRVFSYAWQIARTSSALEPALLCTMPDVAGEDLLKLEKLLANQHYRFSSGIVVLLDGERLARALGLLEYNQHPADHQKLVTAMTQYLQRQRGGAAREVPVAVCINKVDKLALLDEEWGQLVGEYIPDHDGRFDLTTCQARSDAIEALLHKRSETRAIYSAVKNAYDSVMFFAVATMAGDEHETTVRFEPLYVEDPFLWLLSCMGMIGDK